MLAVLVVVARADIDCGDIQVRGNNGDVAETSPGLLKTETADKFDKLPVVAAIEYCVIPAMPVQFNQVIDLRADAGAFKFPGALAANFLVLTEQDVALGLLQNPQDHVDPGPVIPADALRRHHHTAILGVADMLHQLAVNGVHVGNQHDRQFAGGIEIPLSGFGLITQRLQLTHQSLFQVALGKLKDLLELQGMELTL